MWNDSCSVWVGGWVVVIPQVRPNAVRLTATTQLKYSYLGYPLAGCERRGRAALPVFKNNLQRPQREADRRPSHGAS